MRAARSTVLLAHSLTDSRSLVAQTGLGAKVIAHFAEKWAHHSLLDQKTEFEICNQKGELNLSGLALMKYAKKLVKKAAGRKGKGVITEEESFLKKTLVAKAKSKREIYTILTLDCKAYLPQESVCTVYWLKDLLSGAKKCK